MYADVNPIGNVDEMHDVNDLVGDDDVHAHAHVHDDGGGGDARNSVNGMFATKVESLSIPNQ